MNEADESLTPPPEYTVEAILARHNTQQSREITQLNEEIDRLRQELHQQRQRAKRYKKKYIRTKYREYSNRRIV